MNHAEYRHLQVGRKTESMYLNRAAITFLDGCMLVSPDVWCSGDKTLSILNVGTK